MSNVSEYLTQLQALTKKNLEILKALNQAFYTKSEHLSVVVDEESFIIPSYLALENTVLVATEVTEQENPLHFRVETDSNGYFCFEALPGDKEYIITLDFAETISEGTITTVPGQDVNNVEILGIPLGNLNGYVTMAEGQPVAEDDYSVELWLENSFQAHASMPLSDSGTFEFRHLIPGNYYLKVCKGEDKVVMLTSDVIVMGDYGNTRSVALELGHPGRLFGMALTEDKRPCGEENLLLMANGENNEQFCATIQEDGSWEISGISVGIL